MWNLFKERQLYSHWALYRACSSQSLWEYDQSIAVVMRTSKNLGWRSQIVSHHWVARPHQKLKEPQILPAVTYEPMGSPGVAFSYSTKIALQITLMHQRWVLGLILCDLPNLHVNSVAIKGDVGNSPEIQMFTCSGSSSHSLQLPPFSISSIYF